VRAFDPDAILTKRERRGFRLMASLEAPVAIDDEGFSGLSQPDIVDQPIKGREVDGGAQDPALFFFGKAYDIHNKKKDIVAQVIQVLETLQIFWF